MANDATERILAICDGPDGTELVIGYFAEVGGDPEEYGLMDIDGFKNLTTEQEVTSLRLYFEATAETGTLTPDDAAAIRSGQVDWAAIRDRVDVFVHEDVPGPI